MQCTYGIIRTESPEWGRQRKHYNGNTNMANQHKLSNHQIAVKFPHQVWRRIEKAARANGMTPGQYIRLVVGREVELIDLTPEDAQLIADRIKEAHKRGKMV